MKYNRFIDSTSTHWFMIYVWSNKDINLYKLHQLFFKESDSIFPAIIPFSQEVVKKYNKEKYGEEVFIY